MLIHSNYQHTPPADFTDQLEARVWEVFCLYLEAIYSRWVGGPNTEYLVDEYLYGAFLQPSQRPAVLAEVDAAFRAAAALVQPYLNSVTGYLEACGEEINTITIEQSADPKLLFFVVDGTDEWG